MVGDRMFGPYFSPDGGRAWARDGKLYWEDGEVTPDTVIVRLMPMADGEDYSLWSDEKRAAVKAEYAEKRRQAQDEIAAREVRMMALFEAAKAKLTEEELEAVAYATDRDRW